MSAHTAVDNLADTVFVRVPPLQLTCALLSILHSLEERPSGISILVLQHGCGEVLSGGCIWQQ